MVKENLSKIHLYHLMLKMFKFLQTFVKILGALALIN